jgi:hypothetical protein
LWAAGAAPGPAEILFAELDQGPDGSWSAAVTLRHEDTGWDHYADAWRVLAADGTVLGERVLRHPHVAEQPFMRRLHEIHLPPGAQFLLIEAQDTVHGRNPIRLRIDLQQRETASYVVRGRD